MAAIFWGFPLKGTLFTKVVHPNDFLTLKCERTGVIVWYFAYHTPVMHRAKYDQNHQNPWKSPTPKQRSSGKGKKSLGCFFFILLSPFFYSWVAMSTLRSIVYCPSLWKDDGIKTILMPLFKMWSLTLLCHLMIYILLSPPVHIARWAHICASLSFRPI